MQITILCSSLILLVLMTGCREDSGKGSSSEAARIEREVSQRVKQAGIESTERQTRMRTWRTLGFIVLTGGAVAGLLWVRNPNSPALPGRSVLSQAIRRPLWSDQPPPRAGRVIDLNPSAFPPPHPARRKRRKPQTRRRKRNHETPPRP
jgi:hypothetical protein